MFTALAIALMLQAGANSTIVREFESGGNHLTVAYREDGAHMEFQTPDGRDFQFISNYDIMETPEGSQATVQGCTITVWKQSVEDSLDYRVRSTGSCSLNGYYATDLDDFRVIVD